MGEAGRRHFNHPYEPYGIQYELMNAIYDSIEGGQVGIFESPTGTGKSLSLICSSMTWLRDFQNEALLQSSIQADNETEPSWVREQIHDQRTRAVRAEKAQLENRLKKVREKERRQKQRYEKNNHVAKRARRTNTDTSGGTNDTAQFELEDYESEDGAQKPPVSSTTPDCGLSTASLDMMDKLGLMLKPVEEEDLSPIDETKIFYCSRTHSQLLQFVHELRRVNIPTPWWLAQDDTAGCRELGDHLNVKHLPLASRKNLCINSQVEKLGNVNAINERCLELQQPSTPKDKKCPFLPNRENESVLHAFRDHTLANIRDIEDLTRFGRGHGICPYYASRAAIKPSEVVTLPYPLLLQKSARKALGLSLNGHVVVIDEAHNLMDTISNIHSVSISLAQLRQCRASLGMYLQKFRNRLKGKNRVYVAQTVRLFDSIAAFMEKKLANEADADGNVSISQLMEGRGVDQIDLHKLIIYLQQSKLARKVEGYARYEHQSKYEGDDQDQRNGARSSTPTLTLVQSFLEVLMNPATEGRFFYEKKDQNEIVLRYMLLDPTHHFKDIVEEARAVILLGGTMSPMEDYIQHLFSYLPPDRIQTWTCGHIIPSQNLLSIPLARAEDGTPFNFTYENRNTPQLITALGNSIISLASCIPDGLVVFFPSYAYLEKVITSWKASDSYQRGQKIWDRLQKIKPVFQEVKASAVDEILASYALSVSTSKGGLLLSVIGGKLSEGINFSDALGRGVIVVGLPFPNTQSAQWKAKLEYIEQSTMKRTGSIQEGKEASRNFYENACMRAVNQSIGRTIRHQGDFAGIMLLDRRYESKRIRDKLPGWIKQGMVDEGRGVKEASQRLQDFFEAKKHAP